MCMYSKVEKFMANGLVLPGTHDVFAYLCIVSISASTYRLLDSVRVSPF
jgi:hypothetical protein